MPNSVVVAAAVAQAGSRGGHVWVMLQWLLGLRRLGWDVLFVDRLDAGQVEDPQAAAGRLAAILCRAGLDGCFSVLDGDGHPLVGRSRQEVLAHTRRSAALFNFMGYLSDDEVLGAVPHRIFVDIDPGFPQLWHTLGLHDAFAGHDSFVTVGSSLGQPDCDIPTCGLDWVTIRPPVVLERWPLQPPVPPDAPWTSVASWRGSNDPVEYRGRTYGLRVHEFRRFVALPPQTTAHFELALDIHPTETRDLTLLMENGWRLVDPARVAATPSAYQHYLRRSRAEFMVAKHLYVATRSGWFSDRSACYLASGRPVVAQDTGLGDLPSGQGLLLFSTLEEAEASVAAVEADYPAHAAAARRVAEELLDSDQVLHDLFDRLGLSS